MSKMGLAKKGIKKLIKGDIRSITDYVCDDLAKPIPVTVGSHSAPTWIGLSNVDIINFTNKEERFYFVTDEKNFQIDSERKFDEVNFSYLGSGRCSKIQVSYRYSLGDKLHSDSFDINVKGGDKNPVTTPTVPIRIDLDGAISSINIDISENIQRRDNRSGSIKQYMLNDGRQKSKVTIPSIRTKNQNKPVILISIDTLRHDRSEYLSSLLDTLGDSAVIPKEPRTQGVWTPQSHGSIFTGCHPGDHNYVNSEYIINESMTTLGELMAESNYKSSGSIAVNYLLPDAGFGRGFNRYKYNYMSVSDFITRNNDARTGVTDLLTWINEDVSAGYNNLFYFLHVFDPHAPYIPPAEYRASSVNLEEARYYRKDAKGKYIKNVKRDPRNKDEVYQKMLKYYNSSITYTSDQLSRVVAYLKEVSIFDDALIVVIGDHGEEFGERGFYGHNSLYDSNIRPFMIIKPPADASWQVRDEVDYIDILPTIATFIGEEIPENCSGEPLQNGQITRPRITERIREDWYNISVEIDGVKGIFTYEENYPNRPSETVLNQGPEYEEYYLIDDVRNGDFKNKSKRIDKTLKQELKRTATKFVIDRDNTAKNTTKRHLTSKNKSHLEDLGYL